MLVFNAEQWRWFAVFDHVEYVISDLNAARLFYTACLGVFGWTLMKQDLSMGIIGFGSDGIIRLHLTMGVAVSPPLHVAFQAESRAVVDEFYRVGLLTNGRDNGPPGPRSYAQRYYAAYLLDPDNHNIEAVYRGPQ
jgi:catechol 2,3-dioxygenase-like lactoylglutathione lyase family enzyme